MKDTSTVKLYLTDSYIRYFNSIITRISQDGEFSIIELDATAFYPTAGGQKHDTGTISGKFGKAHVVDVIKDGSKIIHKIEGDTPSINEKIECHIDWDRRFKFMQRHTSQHLLSQAFIRVNEKFKTVSVNFSQPLSTIDFEGKPGAEDLIKAERLVNQVCYENRTIKQFEIKESDLSKYPIRRKPQVSGRIRLIEVENWDLAACGAPHLKTTSEALPIKIIKSEKIKTNLRRVYFKCGKEALEDYFEKHNIITNVAHSFSCDPKRVEKVVSKLSDDLKTCSSAVSDLSNNLYNYKISEILDSSEQFGTTKFISHKFEPNEELLLKKILKNIVKIDNSLFLGSLKRNGKTEITLVKNSKVDSSMNKILSHLKENLDIRGGGRENIVRFSSDVHIDLILKTVRSYLSSTNNG